MKNTEQLVEQFEKYTAILGKVISAEALAKIVDELGDRLVICPRGLLEKDGGTPGGLVEFSLKVASAAKRMGKTYGSTKSLVKVSLLHELGKVGSLEEGSDLYLIQDSDWHREKLDQVYKYNPDSKKMTIAHRTLWLISHFGISLTNDEWLAICISQGMGLPENQFYSKSLSPISAGLLSARMEALYSIE